MTISRRKLLAGGAASIGAAALPLSRGADAKDAANAKHLIVLLVYGGWDTTYVLDPKPGLSSVDAPDGQVTSFGDLSVFTSPSRPTVTDFFQRYADRMAVVNGIQVRSLNHPECTKRILTGTESEDNPDMGAITAFELGRNLPAPYLVLGPTAYTGPLSSIAARAGTVNQIRSLLTSEAALPKLPEYATPRYDGDDTESELIRRYVVARAERERALRGQWGYNAARYQDFLASLERSDVLRGFSDGFGSEFTFTLNLPQQINLGLDAIEAGVCHSLHLEQAFATWDTHNDNAQQDLLNENLYAGLGLLMEELLARPGSKAGASMLDETVVAVVSEMGRTPKLNSGAGKDHWPVTSALVFGAGIRGGRSFGASDDDLQALNVSYESGSADPGGQQLLYANLAATLIAAAGADPEPYLPGVEVFDALLS